MSLRNVTLAELTKLRTLRGVPATIAATVAAGAALSALLARGPSLPAVPYCQIGLIALGILSTASEYTGPQIRTSLTSVPNRMTLLAGKLVAYLIVATATALATVAASALVAEPRTGPLWTAHDVRVLLGATGYLVLIGLLANCVAVLVRGFVASLVGVLLVVLVLSPVLASVTSLASYLPDRAGALLYQATGPLTPLQGGAVLGAWTTMLLVAAAVTFHTRDA